MTNPAETVAGRSGGAPAPRDVEAPPPPARTLRILQMIPMTTVGGAERMAALLVRELRRFGHAVGLVSMYDPLGTWIEAELRSLDVPLFFLGKRPGVDARMVWRIDRVMREFAPDVVHTHMYTLQYALPSIVARRRPAVHTLHNLAVREAHRPGRALQRLAFRMGVVPVAIGDAVGASVRAVYGRPAAATIPNGIPVAAYRAASGARARVRAALAIPESAPVLVTVGRLDHQKNHAALISAFASERLRSSAAHLLVAGEGPLLPQLEELARASGVRERVRFLGVRADIPDVLAAADVFVLASHYEGNPLTVMEAMAAGKPIVATSVGCVPELVRGDSGRLVRPGDVGELEEAMFAFTSDLAAAARAGAAAAQVARDRFDATAMARAYEALYRDLA